MTILDLHLQLRELRAQFARTAPVSRVASFEAKLEELRSESARRDALKEGDTAPSSLAAERDALTLDALSDVGNGVACRSGLGSAFPQGRMILLAIEVDYGQRLTPQRLLAAPREQVAA